MVDRDSMFNHLKHARDIEMPTPAVVNSPGLTTESRPTKLNTAKTLEEITTLSVNVIKTNEERANIEPDPIDHEEEKRIDERWKKKMHRANTI